MLRSVGFDDQFQVMANEIDDELTDGLLASELQSIEAMRAQMKPEPCFRFG